MIPSHLYRLPYRALQKLVLLEGTRTMVAPIDRLATKEKPGMTRLDPKSLAQHMAQGEAPYCESLVGRMNEPKLHCFGAVADKSLVAFAWIYEGSADSEMNYGYHRDTATPIELAPNTAFVFNIYTAPDSRGQGWMGALLSHAARVLEAEQGIESFVTTTEVINRAAKASLTKIGFEERGIYWRYGLGNKIGGRYPKPTVPILAFG